MTNLTAGTVRLAGRIAVYGILMVRMDGVGRGDKTRKNNSIHRGYGYRAKNIGPVRRSANGRL